MQKKTDTEKLEIVIEFLAFEFDVYDDDNGCYSFEHHLYGWIDILTPINVIKIRSQKMPIKNAIDFLTKKIIIENLENII